MRARWSSSTGSADSRRRGANTPSRPPQPTPAPWINVIANRDFGFHVSAEGTGFTWARNSRENTLTPWSNDPVTDRPGEVIYLRDEESGELWSPTPAPIRLEQAHYSCTHGFGYTRFQQRSHGLALELTLLVRGR